MFYYRTDGAMCAMLEISARVKASRQTRSIEVIKMLRQVPDCCPDLSYVHPTDDAQMTLSRTPETTLSRIRRDAISDVPAIPCTPPDVCSSHCQHPARGPGP